MTEATLFLPGLSPVGGKTISSEIWSMPSISSMYLCSRSRSAGIITRSPTMRGL